MTITLRNAAGKCGNIFHLKIVYTKRIGMHSQNLALSRTHLYIDRIAAQQIDPIYYRNSPRNRTRRDKDNATEIDAKRKIMLIRRDVILMSHFRKRNKSN